MFTHRSLLFTDARDVKLEVINWYKKKIYWEMLSQLTIKMQQIFVIFSIFKIQ